MKQTAIILLMAVFCFAGTLLPFKLVAPDKSFEICFPQEPEHESQVKRTDNFLMEAHSYKVESTATKFMLSYVDISPKPPDELKPEDALSAAFTGTLGSFGGGTVLLNETKDVDGRPTKVVKVRQGQTILEGRFVFASPRVYQLVVLHDDGNAPPVMQEFFDSFKIK